MATSRQLIEQLKSTGWSLNKIAKAVERDTSLLSQIARGKKPGANLVNALADLVAGKDKEEIEKPERRKTKSGQTAKVRESAKKKAEREAKEKAQAEAKKKLYPIPYSGSDILTVDIDGEFGASEDYRDRSLSLDFDSEEAQRFLEIWTEHQGEAIRFFLREYDMPDVTNFKRIDSIVMDGILVDFDNDQALQH